LQVVQPEDCVIIFVEEYHKSGPQPLAWPFQAIAADDIYATAQKQNNADYFPLLAGQGVGVVHVTIIYYLIRVSLCQSSLL
jgi:hypothetical protein